MGGTKQRLRWLASALLVSAALALCWEAAILAHLLPGLAVPKPSAIIMSGIPQLFTRRALAAFSFTISEWSVAFVGGGTAGLLIGFAVGALPRLARIVQPPLSFLRAVPPIALFPLALVALGPGSSSVAGVAALGAALYIFPFTADAARLAAARFGELATLLGSSRWRFFTSFVAPATAYYALTAARVAATYAFAICIAGEMVIGGRQGVGAAIAIASERYALEQAYAYVLWTGVVGLLIDYLARRLAPARFRFGALSSDASSVTGGRFA